MPYHGFKDWRAWNVALWLSSDDRLTPLAIEAVEKFGKTPKAADYLLTQLYQRGFKQTPDGACYTISAIQAALEKTF